MSTSMREKIARSILMHDMPHVDSWDMVGQKHQAEYLGRADAVLDALMEPSDGMIGAFHRMYDDNQSCLVGPGFRAMILAAKEGK